MPPKLKEEPKTLKLVSLIDIVFLLLIFFLITTSIIPSGEKKEKKIFIPSPTLSIGRTQVLIQLYCEGEIKNCWARPPHSVTSNIRYLWLSHSKNVQDAIQDIMEAKDYIPEDYRAVVRTSFTRKFNNYSNTELENHVTNFTSKLKGKNVFVTIRVPESMEYIEAIRVASILSLNGIRNFGFVGGTIDELMKGTFNRVRDASDSKAEYYTITI